LTIEKVDADPAQSVFIKPRKTRMNKGANTFLSFFSFLRVY